MSGPRTIADLLDRMARYEVNPSRPPDGRDVIRDERCRLMAAIGRTSHDRDRRHVAEVFREAIRVWKMWAEVRP